MFTNEKNNNHPVQKKKEGIIIIPKWQEKETVGKPTANVNCSSQNSFLKIFKGIFSLFRLIGIEVISHSKTTERENYESLKRNHSKSLKQRLIFFIQNGCKYFVYVAMCTKILVRVIMIIYEDITKCLTHIFIALLTVLFYTSVYRRRHAMSKMTDSLSQSLSKVIGYPPMVKTYAFIACFMGMQTLMIIWNTLRYLSDSYIGAIQIIVSDSSNFTLHYCNLFLGIILTLASMIPCIVFPLFSLYYILTCNFIRVLLQHVLERMDGDFASEDMDSLFIEYGDIARNMRSLDENFSMPIFLTIVFTMAGLFGGGYRIAFHDGKSKNNFFSLIIPLLFYLSVQLLIMVLASITNELENKVKCIILCLPCRNFSEDPKRIFKFKKDLNQDNCLTLWKVYVMDRSLVITSIGTLLTYGILIGTLGKNC
ncbi:uncharacterized protein TNIN_142861 [Trichonephila inaurata madagascariensis]|uniref:Uncharacterized protein n=1 Tax=Trichonephila inaurata madagascariensis TaxID=2747483 RepID=A0A8X6XT40_9ARAC|nr:uncharacterized protein TNIN_142861 [Trichonephila inaurata madagascariensis]